MVPFAAKIPQRSGWRGQLHSLLLNDARRLDTTCHPTTLQRYAALAVGGNARPPALQVPRFDVRVADVQATMQALGVQKAARRRVLALCPGAEYGPARHWPMLNFAELGRQFAREGWDIWLFGSAGDLAVSEGVAATCKVVTNLVGRTTLKQAVDLLSLADAVVANDSGLMHLAAALGRPLVAVYGPSDPVMAPPFSQPSRLVRLGLLCSPCDKRECPFGYHGLHGRHAGRAGSRCTACGHCMMCIGRRARRSAPALAAVFAVSLRCGGRPAWRTVGH